MLQLITAHVVHTHTFSSPMQVHIMYLHWAGEGMCMYQLSKALCSVTCASNIYVVMALMDATLLKTSNI